MTLYYCPEHGRVPGDELDDDHPVDGRGRPYCPRRGCARRLQATSPYRSRERWMGSLAPRGTRLGDDPPRSLNDDPALTLDIVEGMRDRVDDLTTDGGQPDVPELDEQIDEPEPQVDPAPEGELVTCKVDDACVEAAPFIIEGLGWLDGEVPACKRHAHAAFDVGATVRRREVDA